MENKVNIYMYDSQYTVITDHTTHTFPKYHIVQYINRHKP
jgi:hypothetical protein